MTTGGEDVALTDPPAAPARRSAWLLLLLLLGFALQLMLLVQVLVMP